MVSEAGKVSEWTLCTTCAGPFRDPRLRSQVITEKMVLDHGFKVRYYVTDEGTLLETVTERGKVLGGSRSQIGGK